eukprot:TRINITY_DN21477_c0_g1_i1.p1 TRINITY_DN21477_c0_g1~~TRINITY_DN21477_c0_g1_i1.p1  ORF type:complete len:1391 (-),score=209.07 TRINITY_DN21477_c0_g1_i1:87-4259(-)
MVKSKKDVRSTTVSAISNAAVRGDTVDKIAQTSDVDTNLAASAACDHSSEFFARQKVTDFEKLAVGGSASCVVVDDAPLTAAILKALFRELEVNLLRRLDAIEGRLAAQSESLGLAGQSGSSQGERQDDIGLGGDTADLAALGQVLLATSPIKVSDIGRDGGTDDEAAATPAAPVAAAAAAPSIVASLSPIGSAPISSGRGAVFSTSIRAAVSSLPILGIRLAVAAALVWSVCLAWEIRLFAIRGYGTVIHEYDPWFNFRATKYLADQGWHAFFTWFDHDSWYPLGRPVATTVYPGMQFLSVAIWRGLQFFAARVSVVAGRLPLEGLFAWTLEEVCCYVPIWLSIVSTLFVGFLAGEACLDCSSGGAAVATAVAAFAMAVLPAHALRSVGGAYDNEAVAVPAMCATFFLWCRALRTTSSWRVAASAGLTYGFMAASWGGYVFALNMVGLHAGALLLAGYDFVLVHRAYSLFFVVGTACALRVPFIGMAPFRSTEQLGPLGVFVVMQLAGLARMWMRRRGGGADSLQNKRAESWSWSVLLRRSFPVLASAIVVAISIALANPTGVFWPLSSRVRALFLEHSTKTGNPLADSVAEHQPRSWDTYWSHLHYTQYVAPLGVLGLFHRGPLQRPSPAELFLLLFAATSSFFSMKMTRLIVLLGPSAASLSGVAAGRWFEWAVSPLRSRAPSAHEKVEATTRHRRAVRWVSRIYDSLPVRLVRLTLAVILCTLGAPYVQDFRNACFKFVEESMSHPRIMTKTTDGKVIDDYREAYWWLRDKTPQGTRVMALWEYGYHITGMANRVALTDGNTWNFEHVAVIGLCLTSPLDEAHRLTRHLADYILVWVDHDLGKAHHMAKTADVVYPGHCPETSCEEYGVRVDGKPAPMMATSLMYHLIATGQKDKKFVNTLNFREAYLSAHGKVRIVQVLNTAADSAEWSADPSNRRCDAPGSWYCPGQYPPRLRELLDSNSTDAEAVAHWGEFERRRLEQKATLPKPNAEGLPAGSFADSCRGCSLVDTPPKTVTKAAGGPTTATSQFRGKTLQCTHCQAPNHAPSPASLQMDTCEIDGRAENLNGHLSCEPRPNAQDCLVGTYLQSCKGCRTEDIDGSSGTKIKMVRCTHCSVAGKGGPTESSYSVARCQAPGVLENLGGVLTCTGVPNGLGLPDGGYNQSCQGCRVERGNNSEGVASEILRCTHCKAADGRQVESSTDLVRCKRPPGTIDNQDGLLFCNGMPNAPNIPAGNYRNSCNGCNLLSLGGSVKLTCSHCKASNGSQLETSYDLGRNSAGACPAGFENQDGKLVCGKQAAKTAPAPRPPVASFHVGGTFAQSCSGCIIRNVGLNSELQCQCANGAGPRKQSVLQLADCDSAAAERAAAGDATAFASVLVHNSNGQLSC